MVAGKLVSVAEVKTVLSTSTTAADAKIGFLIEMVTARLESLLFTRFVRAAYKDRFFSDEHLLLERVPVRERHIPLELSVGELVDTTLILKTHLLVEDIDTEGVVVEQPYPAEINRKEGLVKLFLFDHEAFLDSVIQAEYSAGFLVDGQGVYQDVPDYLKTICLAIVSDAFASCEEDKSVFVIEISHSVDGMIQDHIRFFALSVKPDPVGDPVLI